DKSYTQVNVLHRIQQRLASYGSAARNAVDVLLSQLRALLIDLAVRMQEGTSATLVDLAEHWFSQQVPPHLPSSKWRSVISDVLTQSGLVIRRAGELTFLHYTVQEYLAAHGATVEKRPTDDDAVHLVKVTATR